MLCDCQEGVPFRKAVDLGPELDHRGGGGREGGRGGGRYTIKHIIHYILVMGTEPVFKHVSMRCGVTGEVAGG